MTSKSQEASTTQENVRRAVRERYGAIAKSGGSAGCCGWTDRRFLYHGE